MSFLQESLFYSSFSWDPFSSRFADTCHKIEFTLLFFLTYLPWSLQLSWCLTFLLTAITPATCQGYTYYLPVNMGKCWSLSKLRYSITYQSRNLCLLENVNGKSAELKTGVCEWNLRTLFLKKKNPFSTTSPHGEKEFHTLLFALLYKVEMMCIYIYLVSYNTQFRVCLREDRDRQAMDWHSCVSGIDKGKSSCYIMQMHCKCLLLASLTPPEKTIRKKMQIEKKEA